MKATSSPALIHENSYEVWKKKKKRELFVYPSVVVEEERTVFLRVERGLCSVLSNDESLS